MHRLYPHQKDKCSIFGGDESLLEKEPSVAGSGVPLGHYAQAILGFVEELVVNDDPEYKWIDKIRTPRASNEARQTLFSKLSGGWGLLAGRLFIDAHFKDTHIIDA